jgi:hypothetical protein
MIDWILRKPKIYLANKFHLIPKTRRVGIFSVDEFEFAPFGQVVQNFLELCFLYIKFVSGFKLDYYLGDVQSCVTDDFFCKASQVFITRPGIDNPAPFDYFLGIIVGHKRRAGLVLEYCCEWLFFSSIS